MPSAAVGETTAGVAVEAAVAAILARSMGPGRSRSGAKRIIQARRRGRWSRRPQRSRHRSTRLGRSRGGAERASKPVGEDGAAVEDTAVVGASKPITAGDV